MAQKKSSLLWRLGSILVIGAIAWMKYQESSRSGDHAKSSPTTHQTPSSQPSGSFEILDNCSLVDHRHNDGDSFHIQTAKGDIEFRLYYVDAPESAAKTYGRGQNNYQRIAQQGQALGGLNQQQTTDIGKQAKALTQKLLSKQQFRVATRGESVYGSARQYAFILVPFENKQRYLHEILVSKGLCRIHTKPMVLPDGTSVKNQQRKLRKLEQQAKKQQLGAWGMPR